MAATDEPTPTLFDPAEARMNPGPRSRRAGAREEFLAGMLGAWLYGDKTVPKAARAPLLGLAGRTLSDADRIKGLRS